jgi:hypothetical protein
MSESGQSRRFGDVQAKSALPLIATKLRTSLVVRFVPDVDVVAYRREERPYLTRMRFVVKDHVCRRSSVSIADTTPKGSLGVFVSKRGEHSRPREISLFSATLGRNLVLTWSQPHDQSSNRCCCYGRGGTFVCATGVGTIEHPRLQCVKRSFRADGVRPVERKQDQTSLTFNGRNVDG